MQLTTTRFGAIGVDRKDLFWFPQGLIGYESCRRWVLLADDMNHAVGWLQSATHPDVAVAVISPRRFVPGYKLHVRREQLDVIELSEVDRAVVLNVVAKQGLTLTANLKAPLIFNLDRRLGCQLIVSDDHPSQFELLDSSPQLRKIA